jgi:NRAMP (natural resistance-associated macrophage protein)-like metal ion transporter
MAIASSEREGPKHMTPENETAQVNRPDTRADQEDLEASRRAPGDLANADPKKPWYASLGPGLVTGAADDDPSGVATYSTNGAAFGYGLLWLIPITLPLMIAVQEMCGRLALVTGRGIASIIKDHYAKWVLYGAVGLLVIANVANVFADLNAMAATAKMLFGFSTGLWLTVFMGAIIALIVFVPYRKYAAILKWLCLALLSYAVVAFFPGVKNNWPEIAKRLFVPDITHSTDYVLDAVAFLGTTISPYLFFWQAGQTVEEVVSDGLANAPGERAVKVKNAEIRNLRADTWIGMCASQAVAFFIIIATAGTLHVTGKTDINTAQDAAQALRPLGASAIWFFGTGMIGAGLLAIPTLAGSSGYAVAEAANWQYGLFRRFGRAKGFYGILAVVVLAGYAMNFFSSLSPVKALVYSAVLNGIIAVPLMVLLMFMCNNTKIVGKRTNGVWSNLFGWAAVALMGVASVIFLWGVFTGKAS